MHPVLGRPRLISGVRLGGVVVSQQNSTRSLLSDRLAPWLRRCSVVSETILNDNDDDEGRPIKMAKLPRTADFPFLAGFSSNSMLVPQYQNSASFTWEGVQVSKILFLLHTSLISPLAPLPPLMVVTLP